MESSNKYNVYHYKLGLLYDAFWEHINIEAHPKLNPNLNPKRLGFRVRVKALWIEFRVRV